MRKPRRKQEKKLKGLKSSLVVGLALTLAGQTYAQAVSMSDNLPVPNYVNGASLKYNSGLGINSSTSNLSAAAQAQAAKAADSSKSLNINVQAAAADLKYNSFNVGQNSKVQFNFSNQNQVALNRITSVGAGSISRILGNITQTGQGGAVLLINPNGILFGRNSSVNLNSFMGSTLKYNSSDLSKKTITLIKSEQEPRGIQMHWGSIIKTDKGAVFASNGIHNDGCDIFAKSGNIQLITGDGVTFTYNDALKPNIVSQEDVQASTVAPEDVKYQPYGYSGFTDNESSIYTNAAKISGENLNFVSKSDLSNSALKAIINLDGIIEAKKGKLDESGNITVYSSQDSNINANIKADRDIKIDTKELISKHINSGKNIEISGEKLEVDYLTSGKNIKIIGDITTKKVTSGGDIDVSGGISDAFSITSDGNIKVAGDISTKEITSGGNIEILEGNASIDKANALNQITVTSNISGTRINCKQLKSGGDIELISGGVYLQDIDAKGSIKIFSGESNTRVGNVKASGDLDIFSFSSIETKNLHTGGIIGATTAFGPIITGNIFANKEISISAEGGLITKNVIGNSDVNLFGAFAHVNVGNIKAKGNLHIGSHWRDITTGNLYSDKNITVRNNTMFDPVNIVSLGDLTAKEKVYVSAVDIANIQNIKAGEDILIEAKSLNTNSPDNFIKTTGYYSNILINADEMFIEKDQSTISLGVVPSIELSYGSLILGSKNKENVELIGADEVTAIGGTSFIFSDVYNALKSKSEVPKIAIAHLFDKSINIKAKDHFLGRIKDGQAKPKHLILSTKGNVDFKFTSAYADSTLTVDHCWLKSELIDLYGRIDIRNPLVIQGYGTNDLNNEANTVKVIDATKNPDYNTFDQNFFSNNPAELIKLDDPEVF